MAVLAGRAYIVALHVATIGRAPRVATGRSRYRRSFLFMLALSTEWTVTEESTSLFLDLFAGAHCRNHLAKFLLDR